MDPVRLSGKENVSRAGAGGGAYGEAGLSKRGLPVFLSAVSAKNIITFELKLLNSSI